MAVTIADVNRIYPSDSDLSGYLLASQVFVDSKLSGKGLAGDLTDQITIFLAAHFAEVGLWHGGLTRQRVGNADESYNTPINTEGGFKSTSFGQTAMILDSTGTLASLGATATSLPALFEVVGNGTS